MVLVFLYDTFNYLDYKDPTGHLLYISLAWQFENKLFAQVYNSHSCFLGIESQNMWKNILCFLEALLVSF